MRTINYLLFTAILLLASCSENENNWSAIDIRLVSPEGYSTLPFEDITVMLTNRQQGAIYKAQCSPEGIATFNVEYGYYTVGHITKLKPD
ncbi:MAG: hypothetical protein LUE99_06560 [Bacteroides sp.]|nr:hypothetical protein [Bacteroides sp.]